ncbi:MAG TPA: nitronate monooxygenase family protein [Steroidobacteraceae bacterium]|nr:nitronate monooxygenase family protein [Steroidobacteraceae bacterium]
MSLPPLLTGRLSVPVIGAPLFIVSNPRLVIAQCKAGIVGSFPALNARPAEQLEVWLAEITGELEAHAAARPARPAAPFAVNQIVHRSNDRLEHDLAVCARFKVPITITSLGARREVNDSIHAYGGLVLHDVINDTFAHKAIEKGADGLIAVAAGAGGHAGTLSPFALVHEIREWFDGPLVLSGAISNGRSILAAEVLGADLAYVGSAFIATAEANATAVHKEAVAHSRAEDIVYTNLFSGVHGNYLRQSIVSAGLDPDHLPQSDPTKMNFGSTRDKEYKAWRDIWGAGQGLAAVKAVVPAAELVQRLAREYAAARRALGATPRRSDSSPPARDVRATAE